ncbi:MAG: Asp-tRNA(Asn)/Glu-tRNA(Gln) amidotransferase subunit GatB [Actinobacteria bacterium]|nr:MAG: Asp-tRNA(Asn)/Glu-tRNA(Gln) amidotransferase subunit GatB [Actinomycetota bacterium]
MSANGYETVIGLECHVELSTASKMFCACPTEFGGEPNTRTCPVCLGEPGSLPVANRKAVEHTMLIGLALGCEIAPRSLFHRKNYFYPDMPKNYQISQYDLPLCVRGALDVEVDGDRRRVGITRVHLEEDTGKTLHVGTTGRIHEAVYSLVDYNRAGIPLVEIVSEPDVRSAVEAQRYVSELRSILETLGVSDVRMEEGSMRCDANISLRKPGEGFGTKVEIKNLNSIRSVGRALTFEIERQRKALDAGERVVQETRHFDEGAGVTKTLRSKEEAFDYRYFPEPDLVPIEPERAWIETLRGSLPELPEARRERIATEHALTPAQAAMVGASGASLSYFDRLIGGGVEPREAAVWMSGELARALNTAGVGIEETRVSPAGLAELIALVRDGTINLNTAKKVFQEAFAAGKEPAALVAERNLAQVSDTSAIASVVADVLAQNAPEVERYRAGEDKVFGFLMGQVMKALKGQGKPDAVQSVLREALGR